MLNGLDLFSGIGGLSLALEPWVRTVVYCEKDRYAQSVLLSRMFDGQLRTAPIWDDVCTLRGPLPLPIDIIFGGFPCKDLSDARTNGARAGLSGVESGLWREFSRLIDEIRPAYVFIENVGTGTAWKRWVPTVRRDLHALGYSSVSVRMSASEVGAPFQGQRVFILAKAHGNRKPIGPLYEDSGLSQSSEACRADWGKAPSEALGVVDGVPYAMDRLIACGNAVVPLQAQTAFRVLAGLTEEKVKEAA